MKVLDYRISIKKGVPVLTNKHGKLVKDFEPLVNNTDLDRVMEKVKKDGHSLTVGMENKFPSFTVRCDDVVVDDMDVNRGILTAVNAVYSR